MCVPISRNTVSKNNIVMSSHNTQDLQVSQCQGTALVSHGFRQAYQPGANLVGAVTHSQILASPYQ